MVNHPNRRKRGLPFLIIREPATLWNRDYADKPRLRQLRRAVKEGCKPSRWYYDNPADRGSAYRRRYIATLEVAADIIENSPCEQLADFARDFIANCRGQLPLTVAAWIKSMPQSKKKRTLAGIPPAPGSVSDAEMYNYFGLVSKQEFGQ
ncbi:MAG: hypothetical protein CR217_11495 [Beijerinckiaceae bacterium]|nr:MAG: hypothetical protein CR217_11495 [Beijerinckiaceae bacterium]